MARAAVKAKQQAAAKAQPPKSRARRRRAHKGGGNPNQELFFVRLRRHQKWIYAMLAVVFGLSFVLVGVGSGNGGGLTQLWNNIFGGSGGTSLSKAQAAVKDHPTNAQGYLDLATAYEQNSNPGLAIGAYQHYLQLKPKDADTWALVAGLQMTQGSKYGTQTQNAQQAAQLADPSAPFLPGGTLGTAVGQNPAYQQASTAAATRTSLLYQKQQAAYTSAVTDYQRASKLQPHNPTFLLELAQAAINAGNGKAALQALQAYLKVYPSAPNKTAIKREIKALQAQVQAPATGTPSVTTGNH
jgi:cytochrome c-type biogenesis protein CcmH/NrfG